MTDDVPPVICPAIPASVAKKVQAVMAGLTGVAKTGRNVKQNYAYTEAKELLRAIREQCDKHGLLIIPGVAGDVTREKSLTGKQIIVTLPLSFTIVDTETGEYFTRLWVCEGADMGDKGINKAFTAGVKTFLLNLFLVPQLDRGDPRLDPESDETTDRESAPEPAPKPKVPVPGTPGAEPTALELAKLWVNANPELKACCKESKVTAGELRSAADGAADVDEFRGRLADLIHARGGG